MNDQNKNKTKQNKQKTTVLKRNRRILREATFGGFYVYLFYIFYNVDWKIVEKIYYSVEVPLLLETAPPPKKNIPKKKQSTKWSAPH